MAPFKHKGKATKHPGIERLPDGRWKVYLTWIDERTGRRIHRRKIVQGDLNAAQKARAALREQEKSGPPASRPRFGAFADAWLERHRKSLEDSTEDRYERDVENLKEEFSEWWVDKITYEELDRWRLAMLELKDAKGNPAGYAPPTINGWHRTMRLILDVAVRRGLVRTNAARQLQTLKEERTKGPRGTSLSAKQFKAFNEAIPVAVEKKLIAPDMGRAVTAVAWMGARAGEVIALRWTDDVDGELHVERSVWRGLEKEDKTDDPRRVTISPPLRAALDEQRRWLIAEQHEGLPSGLVFPSNPQQAHGAATKLKRDVLWYRSQSALNNAVATICEEAKLPRVTPHALRRTFEDLTRAAGVDALVRRAIHGWRSERAQGIYATVSREERDAAAAAVVRLVFG